MELFSDSLKTSSLVSAVQYLNSSEITIQGPLHGPVTCAVTQDPTQGQYSATSILKDLIMLSLNLTFLSEVQRDNAAETVYINIRAIPSCPV